MIRFAKWLVGLFVNTWRDIDREWLVSDDEVEDDEVEDGRPRRGKNKRSREPDRAPARRYDFLPLIVLVVVAVSLALQDFYGQQTYFNSDVLPFKENLGDKYWELKSFAWWSGWRVFGYILIPIVAMWLIPGIRVRDQFLGFKGFTKHIWIYVVLFALIMPVVFVASTTESFRHTYPFYRLATRSAFDLWVWEAMYAIQFVALEFFFRGFMLRALAPKLGHRAIFIMLVPYCMIHFGKPLPETLGAIGAGLILGTLAMKTRSIWGGVLIHIAVAISMDVMALRE